MYRDNHLIRRYDPVGRHQPAWTAIVNILDAHFLEHLATGVRAGAGETVRIGAGRKASLVVDAQGARGREGQRYGSNQFGRKLRALVAFPLALEQFLSPCLLDVQVRWDPSKIAAFDLGGHPFDKIDGVGAD